MIEKRTIFRVYIKQAGLSNWTEEQIAKVVSTETRLPVSKSLAILEKCYDNDCYCLAYYDELDEAEVYKLVQRVNKKLIELRKLMHDLRLIGMTIE